MKKKYILVVDDEEQICSMIKEYLEEYDYSVKVAKSGQEALEIISNNFELIILDIMMPDLDGMKLCKIIRDKIYSPIIFLSAKTLEEDKIQALYIGGDDYITKPFSLKELRAKIESHIRRDKRVRVSKFNIFTSGNITIDISSKKVFCKGNLLKLTKKEYLIIECMLLNKSKVFAREEIFDIVWGYDSESNLNTVTEVIKNIRKKIKQFDDTNTYIKTVYGLGYVWDLSR
ncbi:response regulator transcription factor [Tepidibacter thalassicus]|uniref:Stage 0 sporulation protein A homolog n=1 Tax=Tepidibacter thalassicus DSM 15285 TaxID=1123350 RepID=A0A1M5SDZ9_9FIRM|nr:response regulator transcription factor [Tepidibacter thalassicus]SHH36832.1 DNA-binding response regulator, OmpR family, contains REC and winged-helix (wHTH) domain [Tepidibacter thalassicus DSM 15285]